MADEFEEKQVHEETSTRQEPNGTTVEHTQTVRQPVDGSNKIDEKQHQQNVVTRIIWFIAGVILVILAFRFVFSLLGANQSTGFGGFVYSVSHPFVAPFFGLFSYNPHYGASHFEIYTLVAMVVVALIAYGISKLVNITKD